MFFEAEGEITDNELEETKSAFKTLSTIGWRYIPKVDAPGAELSQFILYPNSKEIKAAQSGKGTIKWTEMMSPMQNPQQFNIINSLASLPIKKVNMAILLKGTAMVQAFGPKVLE